MGQKSCSFGAYQYYTGFTASASDPCTTAPARSYLQYYCKQSLSAVNTKREAGLLVACLGIFSCFLFLITVSYMKQSALLEFQIWDFSTVTAGDFTVELQITETMWKTYLGIHEFNEELDRQSMSGMPRSLLFDFKAFLQKEITQRLNKMPKVITEDTNLRIANVNFAYNNS